jgi:hypothetical protein
MLQPGAEEREHDTRVILHLVDLGKVERETVVPPGEAAGKCIERLDGRARPGVPDAPPGTVEHVAASDAPGEDAHLFLQSPFHAEFLEAGCEAPCVFAVDLGRHTPQRVALESELRDEAAEDPRVTEMKLHVGAPCRFKELEGEREELDVAVHRIHPDEFRADLPEFREPALVGARRADDVAAVPELEREGRIREARAHDARDGGGEVGAERKEIAVPVKELHRTVGDALFPDAVEIEKFDHGGDHLAVAVLLEQRGEPALDAAALPRLVEHQVAVAGGQAGDGWLHGLLKNGKPLPAVGKGS